jgi:ArsR family transcriptional regulator
MQRVAYLFKALSEEPRLRILALLSHGEMCVCDLMAVLDMPQSTVSRHVAYLRNAGWVLGRRVGKWMYYRLEAQMDPLQRGMLPVLQQGLSGLEQVQGDMQALERHLADKNAASRCA